MKNNVKKLNGFIPLLCAVLFVAALFTGVTAIPTQADEYVIEYTNVIDDLSKDGSFNSLYYPEIKGKYSIDIIQIAESTDNELFVYTYQPNCGRNGSTATSINIMVNDGDRYNYKLELLDSSGVFFKYKVLNFEIPQTETRIYDISSIYRLWNADYDVQWDLDNENEFNERAFAIGRYWTATNEADSIIYTCSDTAVITISTANKYVGVLRYPDGLPGYSAAQCDSHFVAFKTDYEIDYLMHADVYFVPEYHAITFGTGGMDETIGELDPQYVHLSYDSYSTDTVRHKYKWRQISSVEEFIANEDLTNEGKSDLDGKEWVLRFYESTYSFVTNPIYINTFYKVKEVTILQLTFETDGIVYDLGIVDHKQTGNGVPDNVQYVGDGDDSGFSFLDWLLRLWNNIVAFFSSSWSWIVGVGVGVLVIILLIIFVPSFLPLCFSLILLIGKGILAALKALWWLICLPFRGIAALVRKIKERKAGSA